MPKADEHFDKEIKCSIRNHIIFAQVVTFVLAGGLLTWSATTQIAGAVIAIGQVAVDSNTKKIQHQEGGTIAFLGVREGDRVNFGDVVARLDDTQLKANLAILTKALDEFRALELRLLAERDGKTAVFFPPVMLAVAKTNSDTAASINGQVTIFESRRAAQESARSQLKEQILQLESAIKGLVMQQHARERELEFIDIELKGLRELFAKKLVSIQRVNSLERDRTRIGGERGKLIADIATSRGSIAEKNVELLRLDDNFRAQVVKELADVRNKINESVERKIGADDRLSRIEIKSPVTGNIHQLNVFTVGGVISAGEVLMSVVPEKDKLIVEAQVEPTDIEHIYIGQPTNVHFNGFADRNVRDVHGVVSYFSPDLVEDPVTRRKFYKVRLDVDPPVSFDGKPFVLVPGMPVEIYFAKGDKTVLTYLLKPLKNQLRRVWRE